MPLSRDREGKRILWNSKRTEGKIILLHEHYFSRSRTGRPKTWQKPRSRRNPPNVDSEITPHPNRNRRDREQKGPDPARSRPLAPKFIQPGARREYATYYSGFMARSGARSGSSRGMLRSLGAPARDGWWDRARRLLRGLPESDLTVIF